MQEVAIAKHKVEAEHLAQHVIVAEAASEAEAKNARALQESQQLAEKEVASRAEIPKQQAGLLKQREAADAKFELSQSATRQILKRQASNPSLLSLRKDDQSPPVTSRPEDEWGYGKSKIWKALKESA